MTNELIRMSDIFVPGEDGEMIIRPEAIPVIRQIQVEYKDIEKKYKKFKKVLLEGMEEYGIKKFENEDLLITYIEESEQVRIDNDKLWAEYKDVAFKCQKVVPVKSSVKITVR